MPEHRTAFEQIALAGPAFFFSAAVPEGLLAERFERATPETSREFLVLRTLAEVQKYGLASRRWRETEARCASGDRADALEVASLAVERVAWQRRLLEALVTLINFSTTNEQPYYAHYLAVMEYDRSRRRSQEERDFFGADSELTRRRLAAVRRELDAAYAALQEPSGCWYVEKKRPDRLLKLRPLFLQALKIARPAERTALGYTYEASFGAASERLHFGVLDASPDLDVVPIAEALCGLVSVSIICRAHELCGVSPQGVNVSLMTAAVRDRPVSVLLSSRAQVGDFVLIAGPHVGEVLEVRTTDFGYESCRILFLDARDGPGLDEDWLPAPAIAMFMGRDEMFQRVRDLCKEHGGPTFRDDELSEAMRYGVLEAWRAGVREYVSRQMARQDPAK